MPRSERESDRVPDGAHELRATDCNGVDDMKNYTKKELEDVLAEHHVRRCEVCGEYEKSWTRRWADKQMSGGGIHPDDIGTDSMGRNVHVRCVRA